MDNATFSNSNVIICDAWYGFPSQRRPRKERVLAVSRQICNFLSWRRLLRRRNKEECNGGSESPSEAASPLFKTRGSITDCILYVIGKDDDVSTIQERVNQIVRDEWKGGSMHNARGSGSGNDNDGGCQCDFLHGVTLEELSMELAIRRSDVHYQDYRHSETGNHNQNTNHDNENDNESKNENENENENENIKNENENDNDNVNENENENENENDTKHQHLSPSPPDKHQSLSVSAIPTKQDIVYLSPDADETLDPSSPPPSILVIGMLVDRRVQPDRSKRRAAESIERLSAPSTVASNGITTICKQPAHKETAVAAVNIRCARLPLDALNVSDLGTDEALNIDTVLEIVQRWWDNYYNRPDPSVGSAAASCGPEGRRDAHDEPRGCFIDAAARSMLTHRTRHPNRTIHGGSTDSPYRKTT